MNKQPDILVCDILQDFIGISGERILVYDENWKPPVDSGPYIVVSTTGNPSVGINRYYDPLTDEDVTESSVQQTLTINITSKDRSALERKEEIFMSLVAQYSIEQQELERCRIYWKSGPIDLSFIEGAKALKRFQCECVVSYIKVIRKPAKYFSRFKSPTSEVV